MTSNDDRTSRHDILFHRIRSIINTLDPLGIVTDRSAEDEYDAQVGSILPRLQEAHAPEDVRDIVKSEFARWFEAHLISDWEPPYNAVESIWHEWQRFSDHDP